MSKKEPWPDFSAIDYIREDLSTPQDLEDGNLPKVVKNKSGKDE